MPSVSGNVGAVFNGGTITRPLTIDLSSGSNNAALTILFSYNNQGGDLIDATNVDNSMAAVSLETNGGLLLSEPVVNGKGVTLNSVADGAIVAVGTGGAKQTLTPTALGFFSGAAAAKPTATGSKAANAALASLLTALVSLGLVTDSTT